MIKVIYSTIVDVGTRTFNSVDELDNFIERNNKGNKCCVILSIRDLESGMVFFEQDDPFVYEPEYIEIRTSIAGTPSNSKIKFRVR